MGGEHVRSAGGFLNRLFCRDVQYVTIHGHNRSDTRNRHTNRRDYKIFVLCMMHKLSIRCETCGRIFSVRKPNDSLLFSKIVSLAVCPYCFPLADVCSACRLPFYIVKKNTEHLCFTCYQREHRFSNITKKATLLPCNHGKSS
jgi:hypothetical protein